MVLFFLLIFFIFFVFCKAFYTKYKLSHDLFDYENFIRLLNPNIKINSQSKRDLESYGNFRTAFIIACNQSANIKATVPSFELSNWQENELKNFNIIPSRVDRIYHIEYWYHRSRMDCAKEYHEVKFFIRMRYKEDKFLYLISQLNFYDIFDLTRKKDKRSIGYIFIGSNVKFLTGLLDEDYKNIFSEDGVKIKSKRELDDICIYFFTNKSQRLTNFCYNTICKHEEELKLQITNLPASLKIQLQNFINYNKYVRTKMEYQKICNLHGKKICCIESHWVIVLGHYKLSNFSLFIIYLYILVHFWFFPVLVADGSIKFNRDICESHFYWTILSSVWLIEFFETETFLRFILLIYIYLSLFALFL